MTKTKITNSVELNISGTKRDIKITPRYWMESCRKLDNTDGAKGTQNKPHAHIKPSFLKRIFGG